MNDYQFCNCKAKLRNLNWETCASFSRILLVLDLQQIKLVHDKKTLIQPSASSTRKSSITVPLLLSEHLSKEFEAFWHLLYLKASFRITEVRRHHYTAKQITFKSTLKSSFNGLFFTFESELLLKKPIIILILSSRNWHIFRFLKFWPSVASRADKVEWAFRVRVSSLSVMDLCNENGCGYIIMRFEEFSCSASHATESSCWAQWLTFSN